MKAELIDHMGTDLTVVNAARVSFDKESNWGNARSHPEQGLEKYLKQKDQALIRYLAKHNHWTPFAHPQITMREKVPIFVARQRFKHVVGFSYNEVSRRYVDSEPEFYMPDVWRKRADNVKQGSSGEGVDIHIYHGTNGKNGCEYPYGDSVEIALETYEHMLKCGVCPEQARMVLPQSMYTEYYVTGSLAAWVRAYKQRTDPHAQKEIQELAKQWGEIIEPLFPVSWKELTWTE